MSISEQSKNVSTLEDDKRHKRQSANIWQETNPFRNLDKSKFPISKLSKKIESPTIIPRGSESSR